MSISLPFAGLNTLWDALHTWGYEEQFGMANEEFGECITAINQFRRGRIDKEKFASEVADAFIMANQLALIVGPELVQQQIEYKMSRLESRLTDYKSKGV